MKVASNARKVKLTYRTAQGKKRTRVIVIREGRGRKTLRSGSKRISAKTRATWRLRKSRRIRIRPVEVAPVTPPSQVDVTAPGAVTALAVYAVTQSSVSLSWSNPDDTDLAEVVVRRAAGPAAPSGPGAGAAVALSDPRATSVTDKALAGDTQFSYALFTRDRSGNTNPTPASVTATTEPAPSGGSPALNPQTISGGRNHTCGLDSSGAAWCWGLDDHGQVGDGDDRLGSDYGGQDSEFAPVQVSGGHIFTTLAAGQSQTCGLDDSGAAWCWGADSNGQVGDGDDGQGDEYAPVPVAGGHTFAALTAGSVHTCGLDTSGAAWCWGRDNWGQLGDGDDGQGDEYAPVPVAGGHTFAALTAGSVHTCGIDAAGAAWCWGWDRRGQVGDGDDGQGDKFAPVPVAGGHTFADLTAGGLHTCGIDPSGAGWCWGAGNYGQVGDGDDGQGDEFAPVQVAGGHSYTTLSAGYEHSCGLDTSGAAWCWGRDSAGQVGDGDDGQRDESAPVPVAGRHAFAALTAGSYHTCGIDPSGAGWCWGAGNYGQLGDGNGQFREYAPVLVTGGHVFATPTESGNHS